MMMVGGRDAGVGTSSHSTVRSGAPRAAVHRPMWSLVGVLLGCNIGLRQLATPSALAAKRSPHMGCTVNFRRARAPDAGATVQLGRPTCLQFHPATGHSSSGLLRCLCHVVLCQSACSLLARGDSFMPSPVVPPVRVRLGWLSSESMWRRCWSSFPSVGPRRGLDFRWRWVAVLHQVAACQGTRGVVALVCTWLALARALCASVQAISPVPGAASLQVR